MNVPQTINVDHIATASVCSLRFRGIFEGTNLPQPTATRRDHRFFIPKGSVFEQARGRQQMKANTRCQRLLPEARENAEGRTRCVRGDS